MEAGWTGRFSHRRPRFWAKRRRADLICRRCAFAPWMAPKIVPWQPHFLTSRHLYILRKRSCCPPTRRTLRCRVAGPGSSGLTALAVSDSGRCVSMTSCLMCRRSDTCIRVGVQGTARQTVWHSPAFTHKVEKWWMATGRDRKFGMNGGLQRSPSAHVRVFRRILGLG